MRQFLVAKKTRDTPGFAIVLDLIKTNLLSGVIITEYLAVALEI
jgi:hypothetical protein